MNITIQYPLVDCRLFLNNSRKLRKPYFIAPQMAGNEYIRYFGAMKGRYYQDYHYCIGENFFCNARNALRLNNPISLYHNKAGVLRQYENRLYSDGNTLCKFEVKSAYSILRDQVTTDSSLIEQLLDLHFSHSADVNNRQEGWMPHSFANVGEALANLYLHGSTEYDFLPQVKKYWIQAGKPIVLAELFSDYFSGMDILPPTAQKAPVSWNENVAIYYYTYNNLPCWILIKGSNTPEINTLCRNLRTALLRIHAEKQNIVKILEFLSVNKGNQEINHDAAVKFIKRTLEKLLKDRRFNLEQSPLVDMAFRIDDTFSNADYTRLQQVIKDINNKFLTDDFNCLFAQIDFEKLAHLYAQQPADQTIPGLVGLWSIIKNRDKLKLKLLLEKNKHILTNCKSSLLYDLLKWIAVSAFSTVI